MSKDQLLVREEATSHLIEQDEENPSTPALVSLYHVQIPVRNLDESVRWYVEHLGFRELPGRSERHAFLNVEDGLMLMLWKTADSTAATFTVDGEIFPVLLYRTHDINGLRERLQQIGVKITVFSDEGFGWVLKFIDPNGNMWGVIQDK